MKSIGLLKSKIVVVPLGEVDFMLVNRLATDLGPVFNRSVDILKGMKMPSEAHNVVRNQYYCMVILSKLERLKANSREKVLAVCEEDLYLPEENNVLGYADMLSGTAVISLYEIRQEFYGLPEDDSKIYPRLFKEATHRIAHLFDIADCRNPKCVNYFSQMMPDIDNKTEKFCDICKRQLVGSV
ncbi:MAG: peptidase zinc-dependent [Candidatus Zixiibacteriota bacterium]|nr:MAG: peptidase zinc-dependent [candidate division Zixibacteria bacterium]